MAKEPERPQGKEPPQRPAQTALAPATTEQHKLGDGAEDARLPDSSKFPVLPSVGVDLITLGQTLVRSGYFTDLKQVSQAIVKVLAGQELGIGPIRAMTEIHVTNVDDGAGGRRSQIALGATLMASLIKRSGRYDYRTLQLDEQACELEFQEIREENGKPTRVPIGRSRFTMADAAKAKLALKANWQQYPRNMLFARAMSNGAKWFCSDVFGGAVYTPEEIRDLAPEAEAVGSVADAPPAPSSPGKGEPAAVQPQGDPGVEGARQPLAAGPAGEDEDQRKAREMTMVRIYKAMESISMTAEEMRGYARTVYAREPEAMPVDMLALLAGRLEKLVDAKATETKA